MVFRYLKATEAAVFRWAGRVVAEIGLEYLAPTVHLALKEKSYDRLLAIAEHPIVSKSVRCLHYEADTFNMQTRDQWELRIIGPAYLHSMQYTPEVPKNDASSREWRAYNREISTMVKIPRHTYKKSQLDNAFSIYQTFCADQDHLRHHGFFPQKVAKALKSLCNIKRVSSCGHDASRRYVAEIEKVLRGWHSDGPPAGRSVKVADLSLMCSILHGVDQADIQLEAFCCEILNWHIFTHDNEDFAALKRSVRSLKSLDLQLDVDAPFAVPWDLAESRERTTFRECPQKRQLLEILMSAPDLTSMEMCFGHCNALDITPLKDIVRDFHWSSLKVISFFSIAVEEEHLLGFCRRHSATLKDLSLGSLLMNGGSWYSTFQKMRQVLKLEDADIYGTLRGGDVGVWQMDTDIEDDDVEETWYSAPGFIIGEYLLAHDGKDISLEEYLKDEGLA